MGPCGPMFLKEGKRMYTLPWHSFGHAGPYSKHLSLTFSFQLACAQKSCEPKIEFRGSTLIQKFHRHTRKRMYTLLWHSWGSADPEECFKYLLNELEFFNELLGIPQTPKKLLSPKSSLNFICFSFFEKHWGCMDPRVLPRVV